MKIFLKKSKSEIKEVWTDAASEEPTSQTVCLSLAGTAWRDAGLMYLFITATGSGRVFNCSSSR